MGQQRYERPRLLAHAYLLLYIRPEFGTDCLRTRLYTVLREFESHFKSSLLLSLVPVTASALQRGTDDRAA